MAACKQPQFAPDVFKRIFGGPDGIVRRLALDKQCCAVRGLAEHMHDDTTNSALLRRLLYGSEDDALCADLKKWGMLPAVAIAVALALQFHSANHSGGVFWLRPLGQRWHGMTGLLLVLAMSLPLLVVVRSASIFRRLSASGMWGALLLTGRSAQVLGNELLAIIAYRPVAYGCAIIAGFSIWWGLAGDLGSWSSLGLLPLVGLNILIGVIAGSIAWRHAAFQGEFSPVAQGGAGALLLQVCLIAALAVQFPRWNDGGDIKLRRSMLDSFGWVDRYAHIPPGSMLMTTYTSGQSDSSVTEPRRHNCVRKNVPLGTFCWQLPLLMALSAAPLLYFRQRFIAGSAKSRWLGLSAMDAGAFALLALAGFALYGLAYAIDSYVVTLQVTIALVQHGAALAMLLKLLQEPEGCAEFFGWPRAIGRA